MELVYIYIYIYIYMNIYIYIFIHSFRKNIDPIHEKVDYSRAIRAEAIHGSSDAHKAFLNVGAEHNSKSDIPQARIQPS